MKLSTLALKLFNLTALVAFVAFAATHWRREPAPIALSVFVEAPAPALPAPQVIPAPPHIKAVIVRAAARHQLPADLVTRVAHRESGFRPTVCSNAGACGLMQLMPGTAKELGVDPLDVRQSADGGALYLRRMIDRYAGNVGLGLAAYNWGPGNVDRWLARGAKTREVPEETLAYVEAISKRSLDAWVLARLASL